jgi:hypothetical protein
MQTADIYICKRCALPIRNAESVQSGSTDFTCPNCEVCKTDLSERIEVLERTLHTMLVDVVKNLFRYRHDGNEPSDKFLQKLDSELQRKNPAETAIEEIKKGILSIDQNERLRNIVRSEKMLSEFSYRSCERRYVAHSPTVLRHWAALRRKLRNKLDNSHDKESVLKDLENDRYRLNLERLSKLIGDNPICINRDPQYYEHRMVSSTETRADHLKKHLKELRKQTEKMSPNIKSDNLKEILRFAGNACFITQPDEVIEFRERKTKHLCKYLLQDHILIVVNDLQCLKEPTNHAGGTPLSELVSIHPRTPAAGNVILHLADGRYLPNCVDLDELTILSQRVEAEVGP